MRRRDLIASIGGAMAWPLSVRAAQTPHVARLVILLGLADEAVGHARLAALLRGLRDLGWENGKNLEINERWGTANDIEKAATYAKELDDRFQNSNHSGSPENAAVLRA